MPNLTPPPVLEASDQLLAEVLASSNAAPTLVYGTSTLAVALAAIGPLELVTASVTDQARARLAGITVRDGVALDQAQYQQFERVVIAAPQSRVLARRWLCEARAALKTGGALYLAGANDVGIRSLIDDAAALFGHSHMLLAKRHARVARAVLPAAPPTPEWARLPGIALGSWYSFVHETAQGPQHWSSLPGIFSYDQIDPASQLLFDQLGEVTGQRVLDLGCGYGVIGISAVQRGAAADMIDEDVYAVAATQRNIAAFSLRNAQVVAADAAQQPFSGPYDLVVTNPPFHRGKAVDYTAAHGFIAYAQRVLGPRGRLVLVANSFIRYDAVLAKHFATVEQLARTPSFTVWQGAGARMRTELST